MRKLFVLLALGLFALVASCETLNVGTDPDPDRFTITGFSLSDTTPTAGETITGTVNFLGVTGPFTFTVTFSDCVTPATQTVVAPQGATSASLTITLDAFTQLQDADGKDCTVTITGVDANGAPAQAFTHTFHVGPILNQDPVINSATVNGNTVVVDASDPDGDDITVTWTSTLTGSPATATIPGGAGTATFTFDSPDFLGGGSGQVTFTATDTAGATDTATADLTFAGITPAADTLYAIPLDSEINAGERVRIVVLSGDPANPFFYMTGVRVTVDPAAGALYVGGDTNFGGTGDVPGSFNVGAVGGNTGDPDGIWDDQGANSFLLAPDNFIRRSDTGSGLHGFDFNVTPLDGTDMTTGEGELFNFELQFTNPGTYTLGFEQVDQVNKTYYQDSNQAPDYFWGDITNNHAGIPNTITVN